MAEIRLIDVADPPEVWLHLGFAVEDGGCRVGTTAVRLGAAGDGVTGWELTGAPGLDELPLAAGAPAAPAGDGPEHPNGVVSLDHVVVTAPDLDHTIDAFEQAGVPLRRIRDIGTPDRPAVQAFFKMGDVVVEVVGSPGRPGPGSARFYGLAFTVADLDATARLLGDRLGPAKPAVQPGRRIATLDRRAGSTVPIAFMSPAPSRS